MKLFQYAIIHIPKEDKDKKVEKAKILKEPTTVLGLDEKQAAIIAARAIPEEYLDVLEEVQVLVRPF